MEFITTLYFENGSHAYEGPGSAEELIESAKWEVEGEALGENNWGTAIMQINIHPNGVDNMPDADQDPIWGWTR